MTLEEVLMALDAWAEQYPDDLCSVQINCLGTFYLSLGLHDSEAMTLDQFTKWCEDQI